MKLVLPSFVRTYPISKPDIINTLALIVIWVAMVILVNPIGNFPLNDDWAYGWTVKIFLETGKFQLSDWTATNLLPQAIWGTFFCLPFGFSFTALRISTLVLGLAGVLGTYGLLRECRAKPAVGTFGALVVALNPIYFQLSNSFNSDVPSFTFAVASLYFLVRGFKLDSNFQLILGLIIALVSILNRQSNIVILPAFALAFLAQKGVSFRNSIFAFSPTVLGLLLSSLYSQWLRSIGQEPLLYGLQIKQIAKTFSSGVFSIASTYIENLVIVLIYLGLFLLPFLIANFWKLFITSPTWKRQLNLFILFFSVSVGAILVIKGRQMPFVGNALGTFGLGPQTLDGYNSFLSFDYQVLIGRSWKVTTLLGAVGASILCLYFLSAIFKLLNQQQTSEKDKCFLVLNLFSAFLYFFGIGGLSKDYWFDRYLIFLLPISLVIISTLSEKNLKNQLNSRATAISLAVLLLYGGFTISATHDYLAWNRSRWQALDDLVQNKQIPPERVDGGFEFNGLYFGNRIETCNRTYQSQPRPTRANWNDFTCLWGSWKTNSEKYLYVVRFIPTPGYATEKEYSFRRWLPWRKENLYVQKKTEN